MSMIEYALQYAGRGWRVFPLKPRGKTPLTAHGFKDATVAPSQIEQWWGNNPDANIGIATGIVSGLLVIDLDGVNAARNFLNFVDKMAGMIGGQKYYFPKQQAVVKTSRGFHIYFHINPGNQIKCSTGAKNTWEEGIDVRADGGYVAAPPSVHPDGNVYSWIFYEKLEQELLGSLPNTKQ